MKWTGIGQASSETMHPALHHHFSARQWLALGAGEPLAVTEYKPEALPGGSEPVSLEATQLLAPLVSLLKLRISAARSLGTEIERRFLRSVAGPAPYIIAIGGCVAVGKSTFARLLRSVMSSWYEDLSVDLVSTDGFLLPGPELERLGLMSRKGFPETYDLPRMLAFLTDLKSNKPDLRVPLYSHQKYDVIEDRFQLVSRPDILILEGLNVLQLDPRASAAASDFFDFSIYLEAAPDDLEQWYIERFFHLQSSASRNANDHFYRFRDLATTEAELIAREIWRRINLPNLIRNIQPTRARAHVVIRKTSSHALEEVWLRRS